MVLLLLLMLLKLDLSLVFGVYLEMGSFDFVPLLVCLVGFASEFIFVWSLFRENCLELGVVAAEVGFFVVGGRGQFVYRH